ncbi:LysM peptidoglycan-binding domain-containing protein [Mucilaginibacter limnophilus]|uniref:LysM peptidoglycan-binding domain-containing protein n=1 Tax=Mucilaginibacter limnophilus TaxID=1932778 RepID=A0A437MW80_9SPHI|nr:lytic transglycosylase domain-containing protein [Mucilaginibacter limnophilus]RVU01903.1 LysM peptidoglycan-binding domain-containing protein [Mucilaginibacter limnophilus]
MKRLFTFFICFLILITAKFNAAAQQPVNFNTRSLSADTVIVPLAAQEIAPSSYENSIFKRRLDSIQKDVQLDYNEYVQSYIDVYSRRRDGIAAILGKSKYYFPIYEKAFRDAGVPEEIKYLSIVESELNPLAVSRVGATGPWQFMYATGRLYGLAVDNYVDERRDPIQSSYAAAAYIRDAYQEFGDWLLAIASYNCGKGAVTRAIEKAGANDFWSIRPYLPAETRNYVPAYIAMTYVMNYYKHHNITPQACTFSVLTDTVLVNKSVPLQSIAGVLDVSISELALLNPSYKRLIVNGSDKAPRRLIIPQTAKENYSALYEALNGQGFKAAPSVAEPRVQYASYVDTKPEPKPTRHKIRRGETLGDIADTYGVEVQDLKVWNNLKSNKAVIGKVLRLTAPDEPAVKSKKIKEYVTYKVKRGDTLSEIAAKFEGASVEKIKAINGLKRASLQPGMLLKISGV